MKPITIDVQYWSDRRNERLTVDRPERAIEDLKVLLRQPDVSGLQMTIEKSYRHEEGF